MEYLIIWLLFGFAAMIVASGKERDGCGWFLLGCLFGPFALVVAALPSLKVDSNAPTSETHVRCPQCAEVILRDAMVCKHCSAQINGNYKPFVPEKKKTSIGAYDVIVAIVIGALFLLVVSVWTK